MVEPPDIDVFVSFSEPDRAWVEGYLLDALEQGGVRVHSEATFTPGVPRLLEFERAVQQSVRTLLVLSSAYMSDEYAAFVDVLAQTYGLEASTWPVVPLLLEPVVLPPRLAMLQALDVTDPVERDASVARLLADLDRPPLPPARRPPCPYPGMRPFAEADAPLFYGREAEVEELQQRLRKHPFLAVIGPSGSGKSSLVFAGLVPAIRASGLFGPGGWLVRAVRPGDAPLAALAGALGADPSEPAESVAAALGGEPGDRRLLLVVDQFEELFTLGPPQEVVPFQEALGQLADADGCFVVLTVRADFYPELMASPLWPRVQAHRAEVLPLGEAGLRKAVVTPAERAGVYVDAALVERLVSDAAGEPGALPLVQETLVLLWERLERRFLPLRAYEALALPLAVEHRGGDPPRTGLHVAVARHADAVLAELSLERQAIARRVFLRLVQFGEGRADTRRQQPFVKLGSTRDEPAAVTATVQHLASNRLLTLSGAVGAADPTVDLAHETLIAGWPTLRGWLAERREEEQTRRRLETRAADWRRRVEEGRAGGLLDEAELADAERWMDGPGAADLGLSADLLALVGTSRAATDEARSRELEQARALAGERARAEGETRNARSRELAAQAINLAREQPDLALLLAHEAGRVADTFESRSGLLAIRLANPHLESFLWGHAYSVDGLTFDPDGTTLTSIGCGRFEGEEVHRRCAELQVRRWDAATGRTMGTPVIVPTNGTGDTKLVISPDGQTLATADCVEGGQQDWWACSNGAVRLWDLSNGRPLGGPLAGHPSWVDAMTFSADGRTLAASSGAQILLWDVASERPIGNPLTGHQYTAISLAFSPDGRILASGGRVGSIAEPAGVATLWDVTTGQQLDPPLTDPPAPVLSPAFSPDGGVLAAGVVRSGVHMWDVATHQAVREPMTADTAVQRIAIAPDGRTLASVGYEGKVVLWDMAVGRPIGPPLVGHRDTAYALAFSPDGTRLATGSQDGTMILWDATGSLTLSRSLFSFASEEEWSTPAFATDGRVAAVGDCGERDPASNACRRGQVRLWDLATGRQLGPPLAGHTEGVTLVAFSRDGALLASAGRDGTVVLWDVASGRPLGPRLVAAQGGFSQVAFGADGLSVATSGMHGIELWDARTGHPLGEPFADSEETGATFAFSPDGRILAAGRRGRIVLWDVASRRRLGSELDAWTDLVVDLAFSPDGALLASTGVSTNRFNAPAEHGKNNIILWDVTRYERVATLQSRSDSGAYSLTFSPDGRVLAAGFPGKITVFDVAAARPLGTLSSGYVFGATEVVFLPEGNRLLSVGCVEQGEQGHARYEVCCWEVGIEAWAAGVCGIANRNFKQEEWHQYLRDDPYRVTCPDLPPGEGVTDVASAVTPSASPI
ncbi:MAG: TIR domain-containing protein [Thermomicrobiales bacterium]